MPSSHPVLSYPRSWFSVFHVRNTYTGHWSFCYWPLPHRTLQGGENKAKTSNWKTKMKRIQEVLMNIFKMLICFFKIIYFHICWVSDFFFHSYVQHWRLERHLDKKLPFINISTTFIMSRLHQERQAAY